MSEARLTPKQQILLWNLLARGGGALQKDIKPEIEAKDRSALEKLGYVKKSKGEKGAIFIEMTDRGWRALGELEPQLFKDGERAVTADRRLLQFVLAGISRYARDSGLTFHEIFNPKAHAAAAGETPKASQILSIEQQIRDAFFTIAGHPARTNVRLSALRAKLRHIDRADLDAALLHMRKAGAANLMNLDNPRDIDSERDAALTSGIHTFHVLWIDE